jgi:hypothetical protein
VSVIHADLRRIGGAGLIAVLHGTRVRPTERRCDDVADVPSVFFATSAGELEQGLERAFGRDSFVICLREVTESEEER